MVWPATGLLAQVPFTAAAMASNRVGAVGFAPLRSTQAAVLVPACVPGVFPLLVANVTAVPHPCDVQAGPLLNWQVVTPIGNTQAASTVFGGLAIAIDSAEMGTLGMPTALANQVGTLRLVRHSTA